MVKNLPAMQKTQVLSLSWEDPLEKVMANHPNIFSYKDRKVLNTLLKNTNCILLVTKQSKTLWGPLEIQIHSVSPISCL